MPSALRRILITLAILGFVYVVGGWIRERLGLELDVESVRAFAEGLGPSGPLLFVLVVAGRAMLWLPSQVVLIAAGLCFGTTVGTLVGGAGLMLSGTFIFLIARFAGREQIERSLGARGRHVLDFGSRRSGAVALGLACGYPVSPLSPMQAAAGLTPMPLGYFVLSAFIGGSIRALVFAYFGDALTRAGWSELLYPTLLFAVALAIPLALPGGRRWLREIFFLPTSEPQEPESPG